MSLSPREEAILDEIEQREFGVDTSTTAYDPRAESQHEVTDDREVANKAGWALGAIALASFGLGHAIDGVAYVGDRLQTNFNVIGAASVTLSLMSFIAAKTFRQGNELNNDPNGNEDL